MRIDSTKSRSRLKSPGDLCPARSVHLAAASRFRFREVFSCERHDALRCDPAIEKVALELSRGRQGKEEAASEHRQCVPFNARVQGLGERSRRARVSKKTRRTLWVKVAHDGRDVLSRSRERIRLLRAGHVMLGEYEIQSTKLTIGPHPHHPSLRDSCLARHTPLQQCPIRDATRDRPRRAACRFTHLPVSDFILPSNFS